MKIKKHFWFQQLLRKMSNPNFYPEIKEFEDGDWGYHPLPLLKKVVNQMVQDDLVHDYEAIDVLFKDVSSDCLKAYLSEEDV